MCIRRILLGPCLALLVFAPATGSAARADETAPRRFVTRHTIELDGGRLAYRAVASETHVLDDDGAPEASVFAVAYFLVGEEAGAEDPARRPITFFFNGGPGSSAAWLHLGAFGPRRLVLDDAANPGAPPYELAPNPHTLLPATDLVFVDPVGTGYSRALGEHEDSDSWGVAEDASLLARFIRAYLTEHRRWASPKYLAGESYGTIRAAMLVAELQLDILDSSALNGVILLSSSVGRHLVGRRAGNDLEYVASLPTQAAVAHYHGRVPNPPESLEAHVEAARELASGEYLTALFQGDALAGPRKRELAARLHRLTGLSEEYLLRSDLRVPSDRFAKELLRDEGRVIGIHDGRFLGRDPDEAGGTVEWDPFILSIAGPFAAAIRDYLVEDLEVDLGAEIGRRYELFDVRIPAAWKALRTASWNLPADYVEAFAIAAAANDDFRVFVAGGYHDLATPFFGNEYTFAHSGIPGDRLILRNYFGGHMMYLHDPSLAALATDLSGFIAFSPPSE